jgi:formylglycine-generating enzyme required for sulfatase activity
MQLPSILALALLIPAASWAEEPLSDQTPSSEAGEVYTVGSEGSARPVRPLDAFRECDVCPEMVVLPLGSFVMGGPPGESRLNIHWEAGNIRRVTPDDPYIAHHEGPLHTVTIDLPIAMGRNEVTYGEWNACVDDGGCGGYRLPDHMLAGRRDGPPERVELTDRHPVLQVSYNDMQLYLAWLNSRVGADVYRLPTEAEWEYAARAGAQTPFAQGEEITTDQANFGGISTAEMLGEDRPDLVSRGHPVPVDELDAANAWGLRHMSGNLIEQTMSCWTERHMGWPRSSNYLEMAQGQSCRRVTKGGAYAAAMDFARPAVRGSGGEVRRSNITGFRVVRDLGQIAEYQHK